MTMLRISAARLYNRAEVWVRVRSQDVHDSHVPLITLIIIIYVSLPYDKLPVSENIQSGLQIGLSGGGVSRVSRFRDEHNPRFKELIRTPHT